MFSNVLPSLFAGLTIGSLIYILNNCKETRRSNKTAIHDIIDHPHHRNVERNREHHQQYGTRDQRKIRHWNATIGHDYMYRKPGVLGGKGGHIFVETPPPALPNGDGSFHLHGKAPDYHTRNPFAEHHPGVIFGAPFPPEAYYLHDNILHYKVPSGQDYDHYTHPTYNF